MSVVITCLLIALARITDITLDTVRTVAIVQGRRLFAAGLPARRRASSGDHLDNCREVQTQRRKAGERLVMLGEQRLFPLQCQLKLTLFT